MQNPISEVLANKSDIVFSIGPEDTVAEAVRLMNENNIGGLPVLDDSRLVGIFTERDVLRRVVVRKLDPDITPVHEVMTRDVLVVRPTTTVEEALVIVNAKNCRHLPVMEGQRLLAMLSIRDLTSWVVDGQEHRIAELVDYISGNYGRQAHLSH